MKDEFAVWQKLCHSRVDSFLKKKLITHIPVLEHFFEAMRYASIDGGKRIRAMLVFAVGAYLAVPEDELDIYATAIEMVHAFSLIHDDLPAMDNDVLRRGKPTCHVAFGEATAILAGDALLTEAFLILSGSLTPHFNSLKRIKMVQTLAQKSGPIGMAGGQYLDIQSEKRDLSVKELLLLHRLKTGALIETTVDLPILYAEPQKEIAETLEMFSRKIGVVFQVQDDLLDIKKTSEELGKTAGKDEETQKASFVRILGLKGTEDFLKSELAETKSLLAGLPGDKDLLELVFHYIYHREY